MIDGLAGALKGMQKQNADSSSQSSSSARIITLTNNNDDQKSNANYDDALAFYSTAYFVGAWINRNSPASWGKLLNHYIDGRDISYQSLVDNNLIAITTVDLNQ